VAAILAAFLLAAGATGQARPAQMAKAPFQVRDSIEMNVLTDPPANFRRYLPLDVKHAPDGRHFFIVIRRGNLATGANEYRLLLYDVARVRDSLGGGPLPAPVELARFDSTSNRHGIGRAIWLADSRTIAFLGENPGEAAQLYTIDVAERRLSRLTNHPTPVLDFDLDRNHDGFIYAAVTPSDWSDRISRGFVVEGENLIELTRRGQVQLPTPVAYFIGSRSTRTARPVDIPAYRLTFENLPYGLWMSPDGRRAIALRHVVDPPAAWWTDYAPVAQSDYLQGARQSAHFASAHPAFFLQYMIVDLDSGSARPLLDAPSAYLVAGRDLAAHWLADGRSVILSNTFLPLDSARGAELARRRSAAAVVEVDVGNGRFRRIVELAGETDRRQGLLSSSFEQGMLSLIWSDRSRSGYRKSGPNWREAQATTDPSRLAIDIVQALNLPPELRAVDPASGLSRIISDLNPQLRRHALGRVEPIEIAVGERSVRAGLLRPVDYVAGRRYPLIIQLHGFDPDEFLVDGPSASTAGYAARALANRGLLVVQLANTPTRETGFRGELEPQISTLRALIERLDREGLVDRNRIGIHGHSRTGYYVQHALTFSDLRFAAASVSDASQLSAFEHVAFFGGPYPGMAEDERMIGAPLWGADAALAWAERDPMFNLHRVNTPLRIEVYQYGLGWWDVFALLRRHQRPVEYLAFPDAFHVPVKPWERQTSQQGLVDWYDFWLNGREDSDPAKARQYARWRELRRMNCRNPQAIRNFCALAAP